MRAACLFTFALIATCSCGQEYFPEGVLGDTTSDHQFRAEWYSKHLKALKETSVWQTSLQKPPAEVYRFLWLRTFHHPICVRVVVSRDGTGTLTSKETNGKGGYQPGHLIRNKTVKLSKEQVDWFRDMLEEEITFWRLPTVPESKDVVTLDGAQWLAEAAKAGRYHIVDRWSPAAGDPIHTFGTIMVIDLAQFRLLYQDVY